MFEWAFLIGKSAGIMVTFLGVWFGLPQQQVIEWPNSSNSFDAYVSRALQLPNRRMADMTGDILAYGIFPTLAIAHNYAQAETYEEFFNGTLRSTNTALVAQIASILIKRLVVRTRPEVFFNYPNQGSEQLQSFPSGHTGLVVSLLGTVSGPIPQVLAFLTAYSRVASARHWPTDVLTGAGIGALVWTL